MMKAGTKNKPKAMTAQKEKPPQIQSKLRRGGKDACINLGLALSRGDF
jgi:hypothetical protein